MLGKPNFYMYIFLTTKGNNLGSPNRAGKFGVEVI